MGIQSNQLSYAKPTASSLINHSIKDSEASTTEVLATQGKAAMIVEQHERHRKRAGEDHHHTSHDQVRFVVCVLHWLSAWQLSVAWEDVG